MTTTTTTSKCRHCSTKVEYAGQICPFCHGDGAVDNYGEPYGSHPDAAPSFASKAGQAIGDEPTMTGVSTIEDHIDELANLGFNPGDYHEEGGMPQWATRGQYYALAFSESGDIIALFEMPNDERYAIHVLDLSGCQRSPALNFDSSAYSMRALLATLTALVAL